MKNVISALGDTGESDSSPAPNLIKPLDWEQVKRTISQSVAEWLRQQEDKNNVEAAKREEVIANLIRQKKEGRNPI